MTDNAVVVQQAQPVAVASNPLAMVADAVQRGTDPATIKALMDLAERHAANEARKAFVTALNAFKADPPTIYKNTAVDFTSPKGRTHYKHATLDNVSGVIGAALANVGISHRWNTEQLDGGIVKVTCILTHALGHSESVYLQAGKDDSGNKNHIQAVVSTVTYLERQTLLSATGMAVSNTDDDGRQGKEGMPDSAIESWQQAIADCDSEKEAAELWKQIATATTASGDVEAHEVLRSAMLARRKALKAKPVQQQQEDAL